MRAVLLQAVFVCIANADAIFPKFGVEFPDFAQLLKTWECFVFRPLRDSRQVKIGLKLGEIEAIKHLEGTEALFYKGLRDF